MNQINLQDRNITFQKLESAAKILRIISHPIRLDILKILEMEGSMDVTSLCEKIGTECEISMMSHHLSKLKDNGLLSSTKKGKQVFYSIADRRILSIFDCIEKQSWL